MTQEGIHSDRSHEFTIHTPEGVTFSLPLAGPTSRLLAWMIDFFCISAFVKVVGMFMPLLGVVSADFSRAVSILFFFAMNIGYAIVFEYYWNGQTLGKRALAVRVMDNRGFRLRPSQIVIRNLLRAVDSLPMFYLLGGIVCLVSRHAQRLGDLAANTIVVKQVKVSEPDVDQVFEQNRYNSLRDYPHLVARLRQRVGPREARLAFEALLRRDALSPESRVALFNTMARHFREKVKFPSAAVEGISDEQYVRGVLDVLFRR
ncbi:MAG: RDD family protein [Desulfatitalea sp.]|nr:RDD family protein [Desulfatitalea sp.]NNK00582.1 RDD family protein [Desulfatitalea sp.]